MYALISERRNDKTSLDARVQVRVRVRVGIARLRTWICIVKVRDKFISCIVATMIRSSARKLQIQTFDFEQERIGKNIPCFVNF